MVVGGGAASAAQRKQPDRASKPPATNSVRNGPNVRAVVDNSKRGLSRGQGKREDEDQVMSGQYNSRAAAIGQRSDSAKRKSAAAYGGAYNKLSEKQN